VRLGLLVVLMLSGLAGCGVESLFVGNGCTQAEDSTWDIALPTDPSDTLKIEDCQMDADACDALCTMELDANVDNVDTMTGCAVRFDGSTVHVEVKYNIDSDDSGCDSEPEPQGGVDLLDAGAN